MAAVDTSVNWLTAFIDFPAAEFAIGSAFWSAATGYRLSALRGATDEFATLLPPTGDPYLKVQRLGGGGTRLHLDVGVSDPAALAQGAVALGAQVVDDRRHGYVVLSSPSGFVFCVVQAAGGEVPLAAQWTEGHRSRLAQVCLDIPRAGFEEELTFWKGLLGGQWQVGGDDGLVTRVADLAALALRLEPSLLSDQPSGHLHVFTDNRVAEVGRLVGLGAVKRVDRGSWTLLEAAGGIAVCVVDDVDGSACPR